MGAVPNYIPVEAEVGVMIAFASSGRLITPEMVIAMAMQYPPTQLNVGFLCVKGLPVKDAREHLAKEALKAKSKYLWFVDDDTIPPPNTLRRLVYILENNPDVMVAGGVYVCKADPPTPVVFRKTGLGPFWHWKVGEVFEVESMGAGCMLINCEVFKHLTPPYFPWPEEFSDEVNGKSNAVSEDVSFCRKVREAGFRIAAHGGILCDHFDVTTGRTFQLPSDSYPYQPNLVEQNDVVAQQDSDKKE
jgi:GT2 family glycosyltransferase